MTKDKPVHLHESYWTELEPLGSAHRDDLHALSVAVNWPHRPEDISVLLRLGQGYIAKDSIGRPVGAGMAFCYGDEVAVVGMMITHPKLQAGGLGALILERLIADTGERRFRLNSTQAAHRLYRSAGFQETGRVHQYQGLVTPGDRLNLEGLRPRAAEDIPAILALDQEVFGADRRHIFETLLPVSEAVVVETGGKITGFALCRLFGRGHVIGPLVADDETVAMGMVGHFLNARAGQFVRIDLDAKYEGLGKHLNSCGLATFNYVIPMSLPRLERSEPRVYGLASHTLG